MQQCYVKTGTYILPFPYHCICRYHYWRNMRLLCLRSTISITFLLISCMIIKALFHKVEGVTFGNFLASRSSIWHQNRDFHVHINVIKPHLQSYKLKFRILCTWEKRFKSLPAAISLQYSVYEVYPSLACDYCDLFDTLNQHALYVTLALVEG